MTAAHNLARERLALPELTWSTELSAYARQWADALALDCGTIAHRGDAPYGENIALRGSSASIAGFAAEEAVQGWVDEAACWEYGTIQGSASAASGSERCDDGCVRGLGSSGCGHYTQIVWRDTTTLGCGYSSCESGGDFIEIWVCNYDPPGNYVGQTPY